MLTVLAWTGVIVTIMTALWLTPLRALVLRHLSCLQRYRFACKVDVHIDQTRSFDEETTFSVWMIGRIPAPHAGTDTDVRVELTDITDSRLSPEPVLSADEQFRADGQAEFRFSAHNGVIPSRNAVIFPWKSIVTIPAGVLRFARRGRRKLLFKVSILDSRTDAVLTCDQCILEYVAHRDGYRELQERRMDLLQTTLELAVLLSGVECPLTDATRQVLEQWLSQKISAFPPAASLQEWIDGLQPQALRSIQETIEFFLARGEQTDKQAAIELALQVCAVQPEITEPRFARLSDAVDQLHINRSRFLSLCQKILLFSECRIQVPALLLGIDEAMDRESFRLRLNEEYRKWNARVTHPDERIRRRADGVLSLIAELRSDRMVADAAD